MRKYWVFNVTRNRWVKSDKVQPPLEMADAERLWKFCMRKNPGCNYDIQTYAPQGGIDLFVGPDTVRNVPRAEARCKVPTCGAKNDCGVAKCWRCEVENPC
jgi:hypothetical protein